MVDRDGEGGSQQRPERPREEAMSTVQVPHEGPLDGNRCDQVYRPRSYDDWRHEKRTRFPSKTGCERKPEQREVNPERGSRVGLNKEEKGLMRREKTSEAVGWLATGA